jgi:hypothetical protein
MRMSVLSAAAVCLLCTGPVRAQGLAPTAAPGGAASGSGITTQAVATSDVREAAGRKSDANAGWSAQEIALAQARCAVLLKGAEVVAVPEAPLREGSECGAPAPMRLISIGKAPQVAFSPPPTLTCDMIAALSKWVRGDVQPLARKFMGAPVVRIEAMSSYSCRNAYGRAHGRLSEHARANALDIGGFVTALGQGALVVSDWGVTAREVAAAAAAETKAQPAVQPAGPRQAAPAVAERAERPQSVLSLGPAVAGAGGPPGGAAAATITGFGFAIPGVTVQVGAGSDSSSDRAFGPAHRLGGPKAKAAVPPGQAPASDARLDFLRAAHAAACRQFGTVLGPEANTAHKNHFHIDMADRPRGVICE